MRSSHVNVYMPPVHLMRYDHLAFAYVDPPAVNPVVTIGDALLCDHRWLRVSMDPSSRATQLLIFDSATDLDDVLLGGLLHEQEHTIVVKRHTNFGHEAFVTVKIRDFPLEYWVRPHIVHSGGLVANPHFFDPAVITTLKAENVVDVPLTMNYKNHHGSDAVGRLSIVHISALGDDTSSSSSDDDSDDDDGPPSSLV